MDWVTILASPKPQLNASSTLPPLWSSFESIPVDSQLPKQNQIHHFISLFPPIQTSISIHQYTDHPAKASENQMKRAEAKAIA